MILTSLIDQLICISSLTTGNDSYERVDADLYLARTTLSIRGKAS